MGRWAYFDVDNTLIMWDKDFDDTQVPTVTFTDPYNPKRVWQFPIHVSHVELLKIISERGDTVVVWSSAGQKWAQAVVKALKLDKYVSHILQKPDSVFDDEQRELIIPTPRWLKE
jgi:FMN phosphatase YigB (HAD superfamily)